MTGYDLPDTLDNPLHVRRAQAECIEPEPLDYEPPSCWFMGWAHCDGAGCAGCKRYDDDMEEFRKQGEDEL